jgi:hypothetical protein
MAKDSARRGEPEQPGTVTPGLDRRRHPRVRLGGRALLLVDPRQGLIGAKGNLVDLSEGGCRLHVRRHVDADLAGRVRLEIAGKAWWFPVVTRGVLPDGDGWSVRCMFVGLTTKKQEALRAMLFGLSLERGGHSA